MSTEDMTPAPPHTLIVTGARALTDTKAADAWCMELLRKHFQGVGRVVAGDARGPDTWALDMAQGRGLEIVRWDYDGNLFSRRGSEVVRTVWSTDRLPARGDKEGWRQQYLLRDRRMIEHYGALVKAGQLEASVAAFYAPWATTFGTGYTVAVAHRVGLPVVEFHCPSEFGVRGES